MGKRGPKPKTLQPKACSYCGRLFISHHNHQRQKYCSRACLGSASHASRDTVRQEEMLSLRQSGLTLREIGEKYDISRERVRQIIGNTGELPREPIGLRQCEQCGRDIPFPKYPSAYKKRRFCSHRCHSASITLPRVKKRCLQCGKVMVQPVWKSGKKDSLFKDRKYCGTKCYGLSRRGSNYKPRAPGKPRKAAVYLSLVCACCGKAFVRSQAAYRDGRPCYCGVVCRNRANNFNRYGITK